MLPLSHPHPHHTHTTHHLTHTIQGMRKMYRKCHLVHADLSEYNMLWHEGKLVFIDVGQSVEPSHPHGLEFLYRDCANVSRFFGSVDKCLSAQELFNFVTGLNIHEDSEEAFLIQVQPCREHIPYSG